MMLEDLADLIRANNAWSNGRTDVLRHETDAALMYLRVNLTDVRSTLAEVRRSGLPFRKDLTPMSICDTCRQSRKVR
jgi:hypothetical protein